MKTFRIALILLSLCLSACVSLPEGDAPDDLALRLDNNGGFSHGGRRIDFTNDGRFKEFRYSDTEEKILADIGSYQKGGGSITLLSDRPSARAEALFRVTHEGTTYWVGSESITRISKPEQAALREFALREKSSSDASP